MKILTKTLNISLYVALGIIMIFYLSTSIYKDINIDTTIKKVELTYSNGDIDTIKIAPSFINLYNGNLKYRGTTFASGVRKYKVLK